MTGKEFIGKYGKQALFELLDLIEIGLVSRGTNIVEFAKSHKLTRKNAKYMYLFHRRYTGELRINLTDRNHNTKLHVHITRTCLAFLRGEQIDETVNETIPFAIS